MPFSPRDEDSVRAAIAHSDVVINMIGKHYETKHLVPTRREDGNLSRVNYSFEDVHVDVAERIARLSKEAGVKRLIHVSALAANEDSPSQWAQSKARVRSSPLPSILSMPPFLLLTNKQTTNAGRKGSEKSFPRGNCGATRQGLWLRRPLPQLVIRYFLHIPRHTHVTRE